jgi:hypothetical protein
MTDEYYTEVKRTEDNCVGPFDLLPHDMWNVIVTFISEPKTFYYLKNTCRDLHKLLGKKEEYIREKLTIYKYHEAQGKVISEEFFLNEYIFKYENVEEWLIKRKTYEKTNSLSHRHPSYILHRRNDLPARIVYDEFGGYDELEWCVYGETHRDGDKPAKIMYKKGILTTECWFKNGIMHRDNGPAWINHNNGYRMWVIKGNRQKEETPSYIKHYNKNGNLVKIINK